MQQRTILRDCLLAIFASVTLFGQATTSIRGVVTDSTGGVLVDAAVTVENPRTGFKRKSVSDPNGVYRLAVLPPGVYEITATAARFSPVTYSDVALRVGEPATFDVRFDKVGVLKDEITVVADSAPLNTTDASLGHTVGSRKISQLPFNKRNVVNMLSLQPGVTFVGDTRNLREDRRSGSINGSRSDQSNITLDGVDVNDQQNRFAFTAVLRSTLDSVQEFRVTTLNSNASQGRSSGAQIQLVTKGGTNDLHGSVYEYHRNTKTASNDFFNNSSGVSRPKLIRNIFGGSAGGALKQNRVFFFANAEMRRDASEGSAVRAVPSQLMRQGTVQYLRADGSVAALTPRQIQTQVDPLGIGPSAVSLNAFNTYYPLPNDNTVGDGLNVQGYRFTYPVKDDRETFISKFDVNLDKTGLHRLFVSGQLQSDMSNQDPQFPGLDPNRSLLDNSKGVAIGYDAVLTPNLYSSTRYGFTRQGTESTGVQDRPVVEFRGLATPLGLTSRLTRILPVHVIRQDITWIKDRHSIKFGGVYRGVSNQRTDADGSWHQAITNNSWLAAGGAELLPGDISDDFSVAFRDAMVANLGITSFAEARYRYDVNGNILAEGAPTFRNFTNNETEFYFMDTWHASRGLTITAGLRWSLMPPVKEANGVQTSPNIPLSEWLGARAFLADQGESQAGAGVIEWDLASRTGRGLYPFHKKNFAPRVSIAYSPQKRDGFLAKLFGGPGTTVIRAGAGMFYDVFGQSMMNRFSASALGFSTRIANPAGDLTTESAPRLTGIFDVPSEILPDAPQGGFPQRQPDAFQITNAIDDSVVPPYSLALNLSIGRDLGNGFYFEASYVGRLSRRTLVQSDLAMPTNLRDPASGQSYFEAAEILADHALAGTPVSQVGTIPFWENMWPGASGTGLVSETPNLTATQGVYEIYSAFAPDYTFGLNFLDRHCLPSCSRLGPNAVFNSQYSSLAAWRSAGAASYHSGQFTLRKRFSNSMQFDLNYTVGKSIDTSSFPENSNNFAGFITNTWAPEQLRSVSDYDMTHQFNGNYIVDLPFGHGKRWGTGLGTVANTIGGGWQVSGLYRHTSGLPARVGNGRQWPTNWNIFGYATPNRAVPTGTGAFKDAPSVTGPGGPNIFADPQVGLDSFDPTGPGQSGIRNPIRGDGFFTVDLGISKWFSMPHEGHRLQFRMEFYNLTNSTRFDPGLESLDNDVSISLDLTNSGTFGKYSGTLTNPRVVQFALRYEF